MGCMAEELSAASSSKMVQKIYFHRGYIIWIRYKTMTNIWYQIYILWEKNLAEWEFLIFYEAYRLFFCQMWFQLKYV